MRSVLQRRGSSVREEEGWNHLLISPSVWCSANPCTSFLSLLWTALASVCCNPRVTLHSEMRGSNGQEAVFWAVFSSSVRIIKYHLLLNIKLKCTSYGCLFVCCIFVLVVFCVVFFFLLWQSMGTQQIVSMMTTPRKCHCLILKIILICSPHVVPV